MCFRVCVCCVASLLFCGVLTGLSLLFGCLSVVFVMFFFVLLMPHQVQAAGPTASASAASFPVS